MTEQGSRYMIANLQQGPVDASLPVCSHGQAQGFVRLRSAVVQFDEGRAYAWHVGLAIVRPRLGRDTIGPSRRKVRRGGADLAELQLGDGGMTGVDLVEASYVAVGVGGGVAVFIVVGAVEEEA